MDVDTLAAMLFRDREEWGRLVALLDTHPGGPVHDAESPDWEARHVYAHLGRWMDNSMDEFEAVLDGRPRPRPPRGDDDAINARWRMEDAEITFSQARKRAHAASDRRLRLIESVPIGRWDGRLVAIAHADGYQHYAAHRQYIEAAAAAQR